MTTPPTKIYKDIVIVNDRDEVIGAKNLLVAMEEHLLRRTVRIFVYVSDGQVLLQKRSQFVHKPGLYDMSAGGHVDHDESCAAAAKRELTEELGLANATLEPIATSWRNAESFSNVYKVLVTKTTPIKFDPYEVEQATWFSKATIDADVANNPENFSPDFISTWQTWKHRL